MTKEETRMPLPLPLALTSIEEELEAAYDEEDDDDESLFSIDFNFNFKNNSKGEEEVGPYQYYVAVGGQKSESSMDALLWTLSHAAVTHDHDRSPVIVIVHVFPPMRFVPSPLGMLPKNTVSPKMVNNCMALERDRRRKLLDRYVDACSSAKVKTEIMLIESDTVAKAILDLIPTQNIRNLVVGTIESNLRKLRSKKGSGIASQILRNAPDTSCNIKIIWKGKEVIDDSMFTGSTSSRSSNANSLSTQDEDDQQEIRISTDYNRQEYLRPAVKSPSSLNGYKSISWGKPKPSQITA
ncbi:U-box domain-containing protein 36-like isoform X1 [Pyrus communis]|uniref:U-box domain-containing protein 36-like isoform X1 n=1 Tax=Pyrus communis TaxID=23211 RepID=UPI0035C25B0A